MVVMISLEILYPSVPSVVGPVDLVVLLLFVSAAFFHPEASYGKIY